MPQPRIQVRSAEVRTEADFLNFTSDKVAADANIELVLTQPVYDFPLQADDGQLMPHLTLRGRSVTIKAKDAKHKPTIRFTYDENKLAEFATGMVRGWLGLFIDSDEVMIEGIRFVIDGHDNR